MTVTELKQQRASLLDENGEIFSKAENEERDLTTEEVETVEKNQKEIDSLTSKIKLKEKQLEQEALVDNPTDTVIKGAGVEVGEERAADWMRRTVRYFNALVTKKEDSTKADEMIRQLRKEVESMPDSQVRDEEKEAWDAIQNSGLDALKKEALKSALEIRLHTTSTSDTPKAGYLLPKPFLAEMFVIVEQYSVARQNFRTIPMTSKEIDLKNVATKVVAAWTDEGSNITADDLVFAEGQLTVKKLAGLTSWTSELEEDMALSLLPIVQELFAESIAQKEDQAGLIGDGSATYGSFTGIANLSKAHAVTGDAGETDATFIDEATFRAAKNALSEARQRGAKWIMHRTVLEEIAQFENTAGFRIFQETINGPTPGQLLGFDVITSEVMPSYTSVGADTPFVILGNPSRALMGQRRGITADVSREAVIQDGDGAIVYNAYQADGALLRITERVGFKVPSAYEDAFAVIKSAAE